MYHFILVVADKKLKIKMPILLSRIGTFLLVYFGWSFFYYGSLDGWLNFIHVAFNLNGTTTLSQANMALIVNNLPFVILCFTAMTPILPWLEKQIPQKLQQPLSIICVLCLLLICTTFIYAQSYVPFLYTDF